MNAGSAAIWQRILHWSFEAGATLKGLFALSELATGIALLTLGRPTIEGWARLLLAPDLTAVPPSALAGWLWTHVHGFSIENQQFLGLYLVLHATIKLGLVAILFFRRFALYPAVMVVLSGFVLYEGHRWLAEGSLALLGLAALDLMMILLTWVEYRKARGPRPALAASRGTGR